MRRNDEGAVAIIVALLSVVLFGFGALVIDIGHAEVVRSQAQSTVDAASLAGVRAMAVSNGSVIDAVAAVQNYVDENLGTTDLSSCTDDPAPLVPADPDTCIATSAAGVTPYQVRVRLPTQHVEATFGGLFGVDSIGISPVAKAQWGQSPPECGPCQPALDENTEQPMPVQPAGSAPARVGTCAVCASGVGTCAVCARGVGTCAVCASGVGTCAVCTRRVGTCAVCTRRVGTCAVCASGVGARAVWGRVVGTTYGDPSKVAGPQFEPAAPLRSSTAGRGRQGLSGPRYLRGCCE